MSRMMMSLQAGMYGLHVANKPHYVVAREQEVCGLLGALSQY